jgi:hypothetical protein
VYTIHNRCRACNFGPPILPGGTKAGANSDRLLPAFSLGVQPLANDFCADGEERAGLAPLEILLCPQCGLAQLSVVVDPGILYAKDYPYVTSKSDTMRQHFELLWNDCSAQASCKTVLEIGSNDGDFLNYCRGHGAEAVIGIEPAANLAQAAEKQGIRTIRDFFNPVSAAMASQAMPKVGMIFARHVFCHVPDWQAFMANLQLLAGPETLICIEVPYVMDQLKAISFDQIYHEHCSYLSIRAIKALLNGGPFCLKDLKHYTIHGGAILLMIQRRSPEIKASQTVLEYLDAESATQKSWQEFAEKSSDAIEKLKGLIKQLRKEGKRVVGFGASAKSTVWINAMGLTRADLSCVYDCTPSKWYRYIPGTDIPIVNQGGFYVDDPEYAVIFAWNFAEEIMDKNRKWMEGGGSFIVPIPEAKIYRAETSFKPYDAPVAAG